MKVAILAQYFAPEPMARLSALVRRLLADGHTVEVLTALPNRPAGRYYPGYRRTLVMEERVLGVRVVRTYVWPYTGSVIWKRLLNYGSFMLSALWGGRRLDRFDVLYVYHPPLTISLPAYVISRLRRKPFVYDVQDVWPEAGLAAGAVKPGLVYRAMAQWARWTYGKAARLIVLSPEFIPFLTQQGVPPGKIKIIPNWTDEAIYYPHQESDARSRLGIAGQQFVVMYAGNMGATHGVDTILEAAQLLKDRTDIVFVFVGTGPEYERLTRLKDTRLLKNVNFLGYIQPDKMPDLLEAADVLVVHLRKSGTGAVSLPSRMMAYMASARPMLVASEGAPRALVERLLCGLACEPENARALAEAIDELAHQPERLRQMGLNGRQAYLAEFSEKKNVGRLIEVLEEAAKMERK